MQFRQTKYQRGSMRLQGTEIQSNLPANHLQRTTNIVNDTSVAGERTKVLKTNSLEQLNCGSIPTHGDGVGTLQVANIASFLICFRLCSSAMSGFLFSQLYRAQKEGRMGSEWKTMTSLPSCAPGPAPRRLCGHPSRTSHKTCPS
jgi:hypothetical protein